MAGRYLVVESEALAPDVRRLVIKAPHVVKNCRAGQFVIVRSALDGERIPLTIAHSDRDKSEVTLIIQAIGATTTELCALRAGDFLPDIAGPLGRATEIHRAGHIVLVGGGVGTAVIYPQAEAWKAAGNRVSAIIGGREKTYVILEKELSEFCDGGVHPCTNDGSYGHHGFVTEKLKQLIDQNDSGPHPIKVVLAAGPVPMMSAVAEVTRPCRIETVVSLNPVMVDGTGMCGGCRVMVNGELKFACVDGPEFDAHGVDFKELSDRLTAYRVQEKAAIERRSEGRCKAESLRGEG